MIPYTLYFVFGVYSLEEMERMSNCFISKDGFVLLTHLFMHHDVILHISVLVEVFPEHVAL
jgi:hypothetical protein